MRALTAFNLTTRGVIMWGHDAMLVALIEGHDGDPKGTYLSVDITSKVLYI